jgi:hypothetical protein
LVSDATQTNVTAWGPVGINTTNGTCNPDPPSAALKVQATFGGTGRRARVRTASYGHKVVNTHKGGRFGFRYRFVVDG